MSLGFDVYDRKRVFISSSMDLVDRFVNLAPFSKFGLPTDSNSPGSVGVWLSLRLECIWITIIYIQQNC